jgi:hypothetical protein
MMCEVEQFFEELEFYIPPDKIWAMEVLRDDIKAKSKGITGMWKLDIAPTTIRLIDALLAGALSHEDRVGVVAVKNGIVMSLQALKQNSVGCKRPSSARS